MRRKRRLNKAVLMFYVGFFAVGIIVGLAIKPTTVTSEVIPTTIENKATEVLTNSMNIENPYTPEEINLMCACVYAESGANSDELQRCVTSVILNRVESPYFPDTIEEVIYQKKPLQYACTENGSMDKFLKMYQEKTQCEITASLQRCRNNVLDVLSQGSMLPSNVIFQAGFKQGSGVYLEIENTYFCYV